MNYDSLTDLPNTLIKHAVLYFFPHLTRDILFDTIWSKGFIFVEITIYKTAAENY